MYCLGSLEKKVFQGEGGNDELCQMLVIGHIAKKKKMEIIGLSFRDIFEDLENSSLVRKEA